MYNNCVKSAKHDQNYNPEVSENVNDTPLEKLNHSQTMHVILQSEEMKALIDEEKCLNLKIDGSMLKTIATSAEEA